ncbi:MAG: serine protease, partial [Vitreoscilla sp.]|nr:serine protease [Polaromonas sp.]
MPLPTTCRLIHIPFLAAALFGLASLQPALAATAGTPASAQSIMDAMTRANAAVVGVKVTAVKEARSVRTLGLNRSGSGVVIGTDGLILTIGYLLLEAEQIEITTPAGKTLPAIAVAYDQATGFGPI